jgi:hypothetical protein
MKDQKFDPAHTEAFILDKFDNVKTDIDQFFLLKKFDSENEKFPEKIYKRNETLKLKKKDSILVEDKKAEIKMETKVVVKAKPKRPTSNVGQVLV